MQEYIPYIFLDCLLYAVGKPVYHRFTDETTGTWMQDSAPRSDIVAEKYWTTREEENTHLYEYNNKTGFRQNRPSRTYQLQFPFMVKLKVIQSPL